MVQAFKFADHKTKNAMSALAKLEAGRTVLVVDNGENRNLELGVRNLKGVTLLPTREVNPYHLLGHQSVLMQRSRRAQVLGGTRKMNHLRSNSPPAGHREGRRQERQRAHAVLRSARRGQQDQVKAAVEKLFKVKVAEVRTATFEGKLRRRGRFAGLPLGLEEGLREAEGGRESARVRGDLRGIDHADQDLQTHDPDPALPDGSFARGHHQETPEKSLVESKKRTGGRNSTAA